MLVAGRPISQRIFPAFSYSQTRPVNYFEPLLTAYSNQCTKDKRPRLCPWSTAFFSDSSFLGSVETVRGDGGHIQYNMNMRLDQPFLHEPFLQEQLQLLQKNGLDQLCILPEILPYSVQKLLCLTRYDDVPEVTQGEYQRTMLSLSVHELWLCKLAMCRPRCGLTAKLRSYQAIIWL